MKKKYKWIIWGGIVLVLAVVIWFWKFKKEEPKMVLQTVHPTIGTLSISITATGTVQPVDTVAVGTQVSGTIKNVYVDFNSIVKKGQLLAELDQSLLQSQLQQVSAGLQQARSNLNYQQSNYNRQKQLYDVGAVSKADLETALNLFNAARDNVTSVSAQVASALKNLSYSKIYSPIDGTVLTRNINEGQTVASSFSTPTLFSIAKDLTRMQVRAYIDEADIGNVKEGQRASFTVDAFPDKIFDGTVKAVRLQASVSQNVVTYVTIIDAPNADLRLKPGMTASTTVFTDEVTNALILPNKAIQFRPDSLVSRRYMILGGDGKKNDRADRAGRSGRRDSTITGRDNRSMENDSVRRASVWIKKDSTLSRRSITIGLDDQTQVQVLSGLTKDDEVVTGYQLIDKKGKKTTPKSPFLPTRPGGNRRTGSGGSGGTPPR